MKKKENNHRLLLYHSLFIAFFPMLFFVSMQWGNSILFPLSIMAYAMVMIIVHPPNGSHS